MGSLPLPPLPQEGDAPGIVMGTDAGLNELRQFLWKRDTTAIITVDEKDEDSAPASGERETEDGRIVLSFAPPEETIVLHLPSVKMRLLPTHRNDGDDETRPPTMGALIVTSRRVLFMSDPHHNNAMNDLSLDSSSITLHALQSSKNNDTDDDDDKDQYGDNAESEDEEANSPKQGLVYCQLTSGNDEEEGDLEDDSESDITNKDDGRTTPSEVFFTPLLPVKEDTSTNVNDNDDSEETTTNNQELCQALFDALSKLASLNPADHDAFGGGGGGGGSMFGMMMGMMGDNHDDELVTAWDEPEDDSAATEKDREAMLDRLDHLLVVPPEYELPDSVEGQFDDADGDDVDDEDDTLL